MKTVKTHRDGAVLEIVLAIPEKRNALNMTLFDDFLAAIAEAEKPDVRAVILHGEGPAFCVGGDVKMFAEIVKDGGHLPVSAPDSLHKMLRGLRTLQKPVLAAVHGACAGAGVSLALACDLAFAADDAKFFMAYLTIGISPDGGSTHFLPRHVGAKKAMELFMSTSPIGAQEALDLGLLNRIMPAADLLGEARQMAQMLSMGPTAAYGRLKQLFDSTGHSSLNEQLDREAQLFSDSSKTEDFREGVLAFTEKRMPTFKGK